MDKNIRQNAHREHGNGNYTVGVNIEGETKIFSNRDDEYIISEGYSVIYRTNNLEEAETAVKRYIYKNTSFCVIAVNYNGELKLKLQEYSKVIHVAPIGTIGIFRQRRTARRFRSKIRRIIRKNARKTVANEVANEYVEKTA